jgi:hypothetical protein
MTEYLIIYLYADGLIETNDAYKHKVGNCLTLDDLTKENWTIRDRSMWMKSLTRGIYWTIAIMERKG